MTDTGHNLGPALSDEAALKARLTESHMALLERKAELLTSVMRMPETVDDDEMQGKFADMVKLIRACGKAAAGAHKAEKAVFLAGGRTVDAFFKRGVQEPLDAAQTKVEQRMTAYNVVKAEAEMNRLAAERKEREAAERAERERAERLAAEAETDADLDAAIVAEEAADVAATEAQEAAVAAQAKPVDLTRTRGDLGATASMRMVWTGEILDVRMLDLDVLRPHLPYEVLERAVKAYVRAGGRELMGARIFERPTTRVT